MNTYLSLSAVFIPLVFGIIILTATTNKLKPLVIIALSLTAASAIFSAIYVRGNVTPITFIGNLSIDILSDGLSAFFVVLFSVIFLLASIFAFEYTSHDKRKKSFFGYTLLTLAALNGLCFSGNLFTFYMFYELMSLASFPLVLHSLTGSARKAAIKYLGFSVFGAGLALGGIIILGENALQAFSLGGLQLNSGALSLAAYLLIAIGFSCKAGMFPLSAWLPTAHPEAPAPASAVLSGIITKAGILGIIRTTFFVFGTDMLVGTFAQYTMLIMALITIFTGSMLAYKEKLLKKRLAYSSVSQLSYVIFGLMLMSVQGFSAAMLQVMFHAAAKVGLFLCAGAIIHKTNALNVSELRGIGKRMPIVMVCFTAFSLSLVGIPPFGGFASKWLLATSSLAFGGVIGTVGAVTLLISALLTAGYLLSIVSDAFFAHEAATVEKCEPGLCMTVPLCILALFAMAAGAFPNGFASFFANIIAH